MAATASEAGTLLASDDFSGASGWADAAGNGWSVGYTNGSYRITAVPGIGQIWSYRTVGTGAPLYSVGADVTVQNGSAGLMVNFLDAQNYVSFLIDPAAGTYELGVWQGGVFVALQSGQSTAID
ncbi:MAG: hypothetical protein HC893_00890, partial [Chloroflexaceae bacterium]|nr:hypothetical protein [Chloroflexaceae bacterium]